MNVLIAIDSFKGSLDSVAAGQAAAEGVKRVFPDATCRVFPLADGGEGTVSALVAGLGGTLRTVTVTGPLGRPVDAHYGLLPAGVAVLEMAEASGITRIAASERNPLVATTYGVGELIVNALKQGCRRFIVGIGGSATNDGGAGLLQALGYRLVDETGKDLPRGGAALAHLARIVEPDAEMSSLLKASTFRIACDVSNPLCGPQGASAVFGPQKGATPQMVATLDAALAHFARVSGGDPLFPGTGAAGGLGYAFKTFLNADLTPGVDLVLSETGLAAAVESADIVITGEGRLDGQSVMGKAPVGVARLAQRSGKPVLAFCGCVGPGVEAVHAAGIDAYFPILRQVVTLEAALDVKTAASNLAATVEQVFRVRKSCVGV